MIGPTFGLAVVAIASMALSIMATRRGRRWLAIGAAVNTAVALGAIGIAAGVFV